MLSAGNVTLDAVLRRRLGIRIRRFRGEFLVAIGEHAFTLEDAAEFIFRSIDGRMTVRDVAAQLAQHYDVDEAEACEDTLEFVNWMLDSRMVEVASASVGDGARRRDTG